MMDSAPVGAHAFKGRLFYKLLDGSSVSCECIGEPYVTQISEACRPPWQPINTAPRDGTEFLAYDSRARKMDVCVMVDHGRLGWCCDHVQMDGENGPFSDEFGYERDHITHWMPLPSPPKTSAAP